MWPYIGVYVRNLLEKTVTPIINDALPAKLTPFAFDEVHLGSIVSLQFRLHVNPVIFTTVELPT
jgi:hypothetical protein